MGAGVKHSVSVAAVVVDVQGRVLVTQRRDNGHWEPPGGVLELDESPLDGVIREVREETGYEVSPGWLMGVYKNLRRGVIALVFSAQLDGGTRRTPSETAKVEWWSVEAIVEEMTEAYAVRILDALEYSNEPKVRTHDGTRLVPSV